jgi:hypothetical protein
MKENVGRRDQAMRSVLGPLMVLLGYSWLKGGEGRIVGLAVMMGGGLISETAITRTCPLNELLGIDTTTRDITVRHQLN